MMKSISNHKILPFLIFALVSIEASASVDNFFDDPDKIREWGLGLSKQKDTEGKWPGKRSDQLHEVDDAFNQKLVSKI